MECTPKIGKYRVRTQFTSTDYDANPDDNDKYHDNDFLIILTRWKTQSNVTSITFARQTARWSQNFARFEICVFVFFVYYVCESKTLPSVRFVIDLDLCQCTCTSFIQDGLVYDIPGKSCNHPQRFGLSSPYYH